MQTCTDHCIALGTIGIGCWCCRVEQRGRAGSAPRCFGAGRCSMLDGRVVPHPTPPLFSSFSSFSSICWLSNLVDDGRWSMVDVSGCIDGCNRSVCIVISALTESASGPTKLSILSESVLTAQSQLSSAYLTFSMSVTSVGIDQIRATNRCGCTTHHTSHGTLTPCRCGNQHFGDSFLD